MPQPIICLDDEVRHFAERYRTLFTKPQYQSFVTVLLGLMECEGRRTLSGLLREVAQSPRLSGLSRFLSQAPWTSRALVEQWLADFREELAPAVEAQRQRQRQSQRQQSRSSQAALRDRVCDPR
jgi:hypothetical protein